MLRIREIRSTNLGPETGYPDWGFCGFSQSLQANAGIVPSNLATTHSSNHFRLIFIYHPFIRSYSVTENTLLNKLLLHTHTHARTHARTHTHTTFTPTRNKKKKAPVSKHFKIISLATTCRHHHHHVAVQELDLLLTSSEYNFSQLSCLGLTINSKFLKTSYWPANNLSYERTGICKPPNTGPYFGRTFTTVLTLWLYRHDSVFRAWHLYGGGATRDASYPFILQ
jgi:hypothetical protein